MQQTQAVNYNKKTIIFDKKAMSDGFKIRDQTLPHFITTTVVDWVDVFTRAIYKDVVAACLNFCIREKAMVL